MIIQLQCGRAHIRHGVKCCWFRAIDFKQSTFFVGGTVSSHFTFADSPQAPLLGWMSTSSKTQVCSNASLNTGSIHAFLFVSICMKWSETDLNEREPRKKWVLKDDSYHSRLIRYASVQLQYVNGTNCHWCWHQFKCKGSSCQKTWQCVSQLPGVLRNEGQMTQEITVLWQVFKDVQPPTYKSVSWDMNDGVSIEMRKCRCVGWFVGYFTDIL